MQDKHLSSAPALGNRPLAPNPADDDRDYSVCAKTAARYLGLQEKTLANWRVGGIGPDHFQIGTRTIRYSMAVLRAYRDAAKRSSTSTPAAP